MDHAEDSRYSVTETLHAGHGTMVCRAVREIDHRTVVLEAADPGRCSRGSMDRLRHEYEIASPLDLGAIVRPLALETFRGMPTLVLEDFPGHPLEHLLGAPMAIERFLDLAARIAAAVADVHGRGVVHKDLRPENILVDPLTLDVKIAHFGLATQIPREQQPIQPPQVIEGSLPYVSPEQTGRMNRAIDSRSDLYSLGVILFRMLTGRLPFDAHDDLEWVHCHVAREPPSPAQLVRHVPDAVARIVSRLLAKMADERYQSARGLRHDLERCLAQWRAQGRVDAFPLGERDAPDRLQVPQRLYGREQERAVLLATFERVVATGAPQLLLVSGTSGVGKSSLVHELLRPLVHERGLFLEGKFDQNARNIPHSTIAQAFGELVRDILVDSDERRAFWARAIHDALGGDARIVTDMIPPLKLLVGEPPPLPPVPPTEMEQHVRRAFRELVRVFTRGGRPVVLFVDDLQWADPASLALVESILSDASMRHLLVVGAFRGNEVDGSRPFLEMLERVRAARTAVTEIALSPLRPEHVVHLVAETVHATRDEAWPLATLVHRRTGGNPLFIAQLLTALYDERLLRFDEEKHAWRWDVAQIALHGEAEDVSDLLARKITALPSAARELLETAACLGNQAPLAILAAAHGASEDEVLRALRDTLTAGLVVRARDGYAFAHDRVQQAAYSLVPEGRRRDAHLRIGRHLVHRLPREQWNDWIFEIATELDLGGALITDPGERTLVAELNLQAGRKAYAAAAYLSAIAYFTAGEGLLPRDAWESRYDLTYALKLERARGEWLCGHLDAAATLIPDVLRHARTRADQAAAYRVKIPLAMTQGDLEGASRAALSACSSLFGIDLPLHPTDTALRDAAQRTLAALGERAVEDLFDLPGITDPDLQAAITLLSASLPAAYLTDPNLHDLMCCQIVDLTLRHGNSDFSPHGYVTFGATLGRLFDDWEKAFRFGTLACELVERGGIVNAEASTYFTFATFIDFWVRHVQEVIPLIRRARRAALEHGDTNHACYAAQFIVVGRMRAGDPLNEVAAEVETQLELVHRAGYRDIESDLVSLRRSVSRLRGLSVDGPEVLGARPMARRNLFEVASEALADLLLGDAERALRVIREARAMAGAGAGRGMISEAEHCFVTALVLAANLERVSPEARAEDLATLESCREKLGRWERHCPANFRGRHALVSAELARAHHRTLEAMQLYEDAIAAARESGFIHDEAISHELAAAFHRGRGFSTIAAAYLWNARDCYLRWGADAKARDLERRQLQGMERRLAGATSSPGVRSEQLDLASVLKASQTVSSEIVLEDLVRTLLHVVLQEGGARRACLLVCRDGRLLVEAEAIVAPEGVRATTLQSLAIEESSLVPASLVHYVKRSRERVILDDAARPTRFSSDPYFGGKRPRSVLALPIVRQAEVVAVLYLENDLAAGAFTPDRLTALTLLASQAAISLENARLLDQERAARASAEAAERRSTFLADAGVLLSESLDYEETLARLGRLCVSSLADWCVIDLAAGTEVRRVAGAHADPAKEPILEELARKHPPTWSSPHPAAACLRSAKPILLSEITDDVLRSVCEDEDHVRLVRDLGTASGLTVPLVARGTLLGALSLGSGTPRRYGQADVELMQEAAQRAAVAIENARLYREAQRAVQLRDEFLSIASHELRTPVATLNLTLQGVQRAAATGDALDPGLVLRSMERASRQGERLRRLIHDLLDISRIETGRLPLDLAEVDLGRLARDVVERLEPTLAAAGCAVEIRCDFPVTGCWDASRLDQVVTNLLSNAMKFGAGNPIEIDVREHGGTASLAVRDRGIGVEASEHARIFERFERAVPKHHYGGLGLGLFISRRIAEAHGGTLHVVSAPGAGSTFTLELPRDRAPAASPGVDIPAPRGRER